jgi:hypothetical protein
MSYEEFENFKRTGEIVSNSSYNIGDEQKGLTYWSDNPGQATTYANDFAPLQFKAIIGKPAYVVAAKRPPESDIKKVRGTGEDEVGVKVPIKKADVLAVWEGTPFQYDTGSFTLTDEGVEEGTLRPGGSSGSSSWLRWERLGKSEATVNLHAARYAMIASSDARVEYTPQRFSTQADLVNFAKQELDLLNKGPYADQKTEDADMQFNMNDCIMELVQQFAKQDHSGSSAYYLIDVLNKLMSYQPLTPLTCDDSEWMNVSEHSDTSHGPVYQSIRCPAVFKVGDNKPYYLDGFVFREPNGVGFTSGDSRRYFTPPWTPRTIEVPVIQDHPDFWPNILPDAPKVPFTKGAIKDFKNAFVMGRTREKEGYPIPNGCLDLYFELVEEYEHAFAFDILKAKSYVRISKNRGQPPFILNIQEKPSDDKDADQHSPQFTLWHNGKDDFRLSFALREGKQWTTKCKIDTTAEPLRAFKELIEMYKAKRNAASKGAYLASASLKTTALKVAQDIKGTDERTFILFKTLLYWLTQKHTWLGQPKIVIKATDAPHVAWTMVLDYKHIYFNKNYSSSLDKTELHKHVRKSVTNTFVTDNIKDVVIHEFGHLLTWKLLSEVPYPKIVAFMRCIFPKFSADIAKINNTAIPSSDANVSYYGRKNGAEFLAETFSAATNNKTRNKFYSLKVAKVLWEGLDALGRNPNMNIQPALARLRIAVDDHAADNDNMVGEKVAANLEVLARGAKASRILTHIKDGTPFITISASRGELSPGENAKLTKELVGKLHKLPVSFIPVTGDFEETLKDGTKKVATEHSFFIMPHRRPGEDLSIRAFKKMGMDLCKHFDQQSIGFGDGKNISFIEQNGDEFHAGNAVTFDSHKIDHMMGFSRIGNKRFSFIEHERVHPDDSTADYGDHDWWQKLSKTEREQYVKEHPKTKLEANLQALARSESLKYLDEGDLHSVMKEPAPKAFMALLDKYADHGGLRGLVYEHDLFVWPAMAYTHIEVGYKMGLVDEDEISPFFTVPILSFYMNTNKDEVKEEWKWRIQEVAPSLFLGVEGIEPNVTGDDQARSYKEVNQNSCMRKFLKYYNENAKTKVEANFAPDIEAEAAIPILNLWAGAYNDLGPNGTRDYLEEPTPVIERFKAMRGGFMRKAKGKSAEELTVMDELEQPEHRPEQDEPVLKKAKPYGSHGDEIDLTQQAALSHDGVFDMRKPAMRTEYDQKIRHEIADYDDTYSQYAPQSNADGFLADNGLPRIGDAKYWTNGLKEAGYKACIVTTVDGLKLFEFDKNQKPLYGTPKLSPLT